MINKFTIKDIDLESLDGQDTIQTSDFIIGRLNKIVIDTKGIIEFLRIIFYDENGIELVNLIPKNDTVVTPRIKVVDQITTGIYEMPVIYGFISIKIIGLQEGTKIDNISFYIE